METNNNKENGLEIIIEEENLLEINEIRKDVSRPKEYKMGRNDSLIDDMRMQKMIKLYELFKKAVQEATMNNHIIGLSDPKKKKIDGFLDKKGPHIIAPPKELEEIFEELLNKQFNGVYFISILMKDDLISKRRTVFAVMYLQCKIGLINHWGVHVEFNRDTYKFEVIGVWPTD